MKKGKTEQLSKNKPSFGGWQAHLPASCPIPGIQGGVTRPYTCLIVCKHSHSRAPWNTQPQHSACLKPGIQTFSHWNYFKFPLTLSQILLKLGRRYQTAVKKVSSVKYQRWNFIVGGLYQKRESGFFKRAEQAAIKHTSPLSLLNVIIQ